MSNLIQKVVYIKLFFIIIQLLFFLFISQGYSAAYLVGYSMSSKNDSALNHSILKDYSFVFTKKILMEEARVGDVLVIDKIAHRLLKILPTEIILKGDNNDVTETYLISSLGDQVVKVIFSIKKDISLFKFFELLLFNSKKMIYEYSIWMHRLFSLEEIFVIILSLFFKKLIFFKIYLHLLFLKNMCILTYQVLVHSLLSLFRICEFIRLFSFLETFVLLLSFWA